MNDGAERSVAQYIDKIVREARQAERETIVQDLKDWSRPLGDSPADEAMRLVIARIQGGEPNPCGCLFQSTRFAFTLYHCDQEVGHEGAHRSTPSRFQWPADQGYWLQTSNPIHQFGSEDA